MTDDRGSAALPTGPEIERLSALVDGELAPHEQAELVAALAHDVQATARVADYQRQCAALRSLFPLPSDVRYVLVQPRRAWWWRPAAALACVGAGMVLGTSNAWLPSHEADPWDFARHADLAYAVYAPEQRHPVEVAATDQAHLVAWLSHRLGRTLTIPVLDEYGYTLMGGRLLPGAAGPAAQMMYQNQAGERLTLYITAAAPQRAAFRLLRQDDRHTFYWASAGAGYALSGQRSEPRLREIAIDVCGSLGGNPQAWQ
ncbi:anti-sigma factor [Cupriavidus necator]|uniref:Anti-sigma factor n=1 Tax=Cupriavidus necator TaxID=106590 RepID=A0A1U9UXT2_CUPNE|nr:anti-sigma factor [Cupriavidus necator]AQV97480.1 anti-sigma factor [Cupriavidus necator]